MIVDENLILIKDKSTYQNLELQPGNMEISALHLSAVPQWSVQL